MAGGTVTSGPVDSATRDFEFQQDVQRLVSGEPKRTSDDRTRHVDPYFTRDYKTSRSSRKEKRASRRD